LPRSLEKIYLIFILRPYTKKFPARFENLVATSLPKKLNFLEDRDGYHYELNYIRDKEGREVDFAIVKDGKLEV
jgi:predicted AAA+ superfamily ATPase